jgi:hypothetical protein
MVLIWLWVTHLFNFIRFFLSETAWTYQYIPVFYNNKMNLQISEEHVARNCKPPFFKLSLCIFIFNQISLLFHLLFLYSLCSYPYNLMATTAFICWPWGPTLCQLDQLLPIGSRLFKYIQQHTAGFTEYNWTPAHPKTGPVGPILLEIRKQKQFSEKGGNSVLRASVHDTANIGCIFKYLWPNPNHFLKRIYFLRFQWFDLFRMLLPVVVRKNQIHNTSSPLAQNGNEVQGSKLYS